MAILIQKQLGTVNIIDTSKAAGQQISISLSLDSTASPFPRTGDDFNYIQTYDSRGDTVYKIVLDGFLQYQDEGGAPATWGGTLDELNNKLNNEYFVQASGGGGGGGNVVVTNNPDPSTATKQDQQTSNSATSNTNEALIIIEELKQTAELEGINSVVTDIEDNAKKKPIGSLLELTSDDGGDWSGFPLDLIELILTVNGASTSYPLNSLSSPTNKDLAQQLNSVQSVLAFDWVSGSDDLVFNGVEVANSEVTSITIEDGNSGTLEYTSFAEQRDLETGAVQQVAVLLQKQNAILTKQPSTPQPSRLVNPSSVAFTGFKSLSFSCDGANDSITVTQGGNLVTYPHANLDGSLVRGYEIPFNNVAYSNSITFNGTGTVDVFKID